MIREGVRLGSWGDITRKESEVQEGKGIFSESEWQVFGEKADRVKGFASRDGNGVATLVRLNFFTNHQ